MKYKKFNENVLLSKSDNFYADKMKLKDDYIFSVSNLIGNSLNKDIRLTYSGFETRQLLKGLKTPSFRKIIMYKLKNYS